MTDLPPDLQQLLARAAKIELFAIFMTPTDKFQSATTPDGAVLLIAHLKYLFDLQDQNRLLAAGPLDFNITASKECASYAPVRARKSKRSPPTSPTVRPGGEPTLCGHGSSTKECL